MSPGAPPEPIENRKSKIENPRDWLVSLVTLVVGVAVIAHLTRYNQNTWIGEEYLLVNTVFLFFVPFLLIFVVFRERAEDFGFKPAENRAGNTAALLFVAMVPVMLIASRFPMFQSYYPMRPQTAYSWSFFLYWQIAYGFYMFCWEFFYRGFLTFGLKRTFGPIAAVTVQTLGFGLMHWSKPMPEFYGSFIAGALLGWLALKGKSFFPCFAVHWAVSLAFDILAIHARTGSIF
jgi:membrane protease YdiL (CAAX protease family)